MCTEDYEGRPVLKTVYRHFKGHLVLPVDFAFCSETEEIVVIYICFSDMRKYTRRIDDWYTDVSERPDNTTGNKMRFEVFDINVVNN